MNYPQLPTIAIHTDNRRKDDVIADQYLLIRRMGIALLFAVVLLVGTMLRLAFAEGWVR